MSMADAPGQGLALGADGVARCYWRETTPDYHRYHDLEWGTPLADDDRLLERICLEGFQAGLSWLTILRKRDAFRDAFAGFEMRRLAQFTEDDVERLLRNPSIVRNGPKIRAAINNARRALDLVREEGSLARWLWGFEPRPEERTAMVDLAHWKGVTRTLASTRMSSALKARGWAFVGPTTCYALMQATGMVNDHIEGCACRAHVEERRRRFQRPGRLIRCASPRPDDVRASWRRPPGSR